MSIVLSLFRRTESESEELLAWSPPENPPREIPPPRGFLRRLVQAFSVQPTESEPERPFPENFYEDRTAYLDKSWQLLHFLLCGSFDDPPIMPEGFLSDGGNEVSHTDAGYGPMRRLKPTEVREVNQMLQSLTPEIMESRIDLAQLRETHLLWTTPTDNDDELREVRSEIFEYMAVLRKFMSRAAKDGDSVFIQIY